MKKTLKSNKGFSLIELIVVILIMVILAVALAPQVMKWVSNSRVANDASTYSTLYSGVQVLLTDEEVISHVKKDNANKITVTMKKTGTEVTVGGSPATTSSASAAKCAAKLAGFVGSAKYSSTSNAHIIPDCVRTSGDVDYVITVEKSATAADGFVITKTTPPGSDLVK